MSFVEQLRGAQGKDPIYLIHALDINQKEAWYVLKIPEMLRQPFLDMLKSGNLKLDEYGEILESGFGAPPEDATERYKEA